MRLGVRLRVRDWEGEAGSEAESERLGGRG